MDKEAYKIYLSSDHWKETRKKRLELDGYKCCICGIGCDLDVHHLSYDRLWNEDVEHDLVTLCRVCHKTFHDFMSEYIPEVKEINKRWKDEAEQALTEIANKYREESGNHLANVVYKFIGNDPNPRIARIIKVFRQGLEYSAGYTMVYPSFAKGNSYTTAAKKLSQLRRK